MHQAVHLSVPLRIAASGALARPQWPGCLELLPRGLPRSSAVAPLLEVLQRLRCGAPAARLLGELELGLVLGEVLGKGRLLGVPALF